MSQPIIKYCCASAHDFKITFATDAEAWRFVDKNNHPAIKILKAATTALAAKPNGAQSVYVSVLHPNRDYAETVLKYAVTQSTK